MPADQPDTSGSVTMQSRDSTLFRMVWSIGVAGKRHLPDEAAARDALRVMIDELKRQADAADAELIAVSSIAMGADMIFAEECLLARVPWKAILPFDREEFRKDEFTDELWSRLEQCLARAFDVVILPADVSQIRLLQPDHPSAATNQNTRNHAYLDCGYRVVEEADVMLFLYDGKSAGLGGTADAFAYATETLKKPSWHWHPETCKATRLLWPGECPARKDRTLFVDPVLQQLTRRCAAVDAPAPASDRPHPATPRELGLLQLQVQSDALAESHRVDSQRTMWQIITLHLGATTAAAVSVAFFPHHLEAFTIAAVIAVSLALTKPLLAAIALWKDSHLHHGHGREDWVGARVVSELCRSALACWPLPRPPPHAFDDEDFPHFKRLLVSLRLARRLDSDAKLARWTTDEACDYYCRHRLLDQAAYFQRKIGPARWNHRLWGGLFALATWAVIILGAFMVFAHWPGQHLLQVPDLLDSTLKCLLIVFPFLATYALAMQSIYDTRRRRDRFQHMIDFAAERALWLSQTPSTSSRIRLIESTERLLLEEIHEWHAVMKQVTV